MRQLTVVLVACFVGAALSVGLVAAARSAKPSQITNRDRPILKKARELEARNPVGFPTAVTPELDFDFGTLNPATTMKHTFVIRNTGPVALVLKQGPTTCKCTVGNLSKTTIFPGKEADLTLEWNTGRSEATFRQSAKLYTNDPDRREIDFQVHGKVRVACAAEPSEIVFPAIIPGTTSSAETLVCSQKWPEFSLTSIKSNLEGLTWNVEPLSAAALAELDARSGYRVTLTSPLGFSESRLNGSLQLTAQGPDEGDLPENLELTLIGKLGSRIAVYGSQIDENGVVDLGLLKPGQGAKVSLMLRVRDEVQHLNVREIKVRPDLVRARFSPYADSTGVAKPGLYRLELEIPADAPPCRHQGVDQGNVTLEFDHPRIDRLSLKLSFAIQSNELD